MGRSLGTGSATYLAARYKVGMLVLISPFTSIKAIVKDSFGTFGAIWVKDAFVNIKEIKHVTSTTLILHGRKDEIIQIAQCESLKGIFAKTKNK